MNKGFIQLNLQLFAKEGAGGEKTEEATPKKLYDARKQGQVARSNDIVSAFVLLGLFLAMKIFIGSIGNSMLEVYQEEYSSLSDIVQDGFTVNRSLAIFQELILYIIKMALPFMLFAFVISFVIDLWQVKWKVSGEALKPKLSKINPLRGFKRIISAEKIFEFVKSVVKLLILGAVVYTTLKANVALIFEFYDYSLRQAIEVIGDLIITLGIKISVCFLIFALADVFYQKKKFQRDMRMTKQEVKDEYKNTEGDPQIKGKIRQKMREVARQRMMQSVPEADVVITNPTHLAVAIKYDKDSNGAPVVAAKGADYVAAKIKDIARENQVEIVENKPLARMLYFNVELGQEIPQEMYQMVAEVLAYVYRIKNKI